MTSNILDVISQRIKTEKYTDIPVIDVAPQYNDNFTLGLKRLSDVLIASLVSCFSHHSLHLLLSWLSYLLQDQSSLNKPE